MGMLLNPDNTAFKEAVNSAIYVDKSELIKCTNKVLETNDRYICVSRPRRFGKSMAADMLVAYYSKSCDSKELFSSYKIAKDNSFEKYLNKYNVIHINMVNFLGKTDSVENDLKKLCKRIIHEIKRENGDVDCFDWDDINTVLAEVFDTKKIPFIFIIDEWDCIFRIHKDDEPSQKLYLNFLSDVLKDHSYIALAYMTGILPIKKIGVHTSLNMFTEISMINAREYAEFTGFTENEVQEICRRYDMSFNEIKHWFNGYNIKGISIYNPLSVVKSATRHNIQNYWAATDAYEALKVLILTNFDGLKEKIAAMLDGQRVSVDTVTFQNDMTSMKSADDILTLLVHLGYLTYNSTGVGEGEVWISNNEVRIDFINSLLR